MVNAPENPSGVKFLFFYGEPLLIEKVYNSTPLGFVVCNTFVFYNNSTPLGFFQAQF
jgi:hypothetical protein